MWTDPCRGTKFGTLFPVYREIEMVLFFMWQTLIFKSLSDFEFTIKHYPVRRCQWQMDDPLTSEKVKNRAKQRKLAILWSQSLFQVNHLISMIN